MDALDFYITIKLFLITNKKKEYLKKKISFSNESLKMNYK